jgi:hypothetical protein
MTFTKQLRVQEGIGTLMRCMRGADIPEMNGETSAILILEKLDHARHGAMVLYLANGRAAGQAFPATADEAYTIAKDWKSYSA